MLHIGYHESTSKGLEGLALEALSVGADTFAFFTRNPRGGKAKAIDLEDAAKLCKLMNENNFASPVAHAPYTMNPCSADEGLRKYALEMMIEDLLYLENIPGCFYNFHPGSHVGQGSDVGIDFTSTLICEALKQAESKINANCKTKLLVETMSGKGSEIGRNFDEVALILQKAEEKYGSSLKDKVGVCLDTCHIWDGGYDIVNNLDEVLAEFDKKIGIDRLCAIHLNDSMNDFDTHKDRHQKLGQGKIGLQALVNVINHPLLKNLPFILETPNEHDGYKAEIETLKNQFRG